jgi:xylulose-5-phosphate/fructose-6-phosphate phosphoketolase
MDVLDRVPGLGNRYAGLRQAMIDARLEARAYTQERGEDIPAVANWVWPGVGEAQLGKDVSATLFTGGDNE